MLAPSCHLALAFPVHGTSSFPQVPCCHRRLDTTCSGSVLHEAMLAVYTEPTHRLWVCCVVEGSTSTGQLT